MKRVLIANRGEIACRIIRSCRQRGLETVSVHSDVDKDALHCEYADIAVEIGAGPAQQSYLVAERILAAAHETGADAIHPGYGFLAENASFARAIIDAGLTWIGPRPETISEMGDKERARVLASQAGLPLAAGSARFPVGDLAGLDDAGHATGFPLLVKASSGGGGIGMRRVDRIDDLHGAIVSTQQLAERAFGDGTVYLEKLVANARHVEVQVFGLGDGRVIHMFERDCSIQRRFQKIVEESAAPGIEASRLQPMLDGAVELARQQRYAGAGTVEFIYDNDTGAFYFLEMNTRVQVEHPVTEMRTGLDLVGMQLDLAAGHEPQPSRQEQVHADGHAIECRIYSERPEKNFLPSPGPLEVFRLAEAGDGLRIDTGVREGDRIHHFYDPMIAKFITHGIERSDAIERMRAALSATVIEGIATNIPFLLRLLAHPAFRDNRLDTEFINHHKAELLKPDEPSKDGRHAVAG